MLYACFHLTPDIDLVVVAFRGMFSKEVIGKMKKGAYLVNNARGAIVDREAVVEACKSGQLGGIHPASPLLLLPPPLVTGVPLPFSPLLHLAPNSPYCLSALCAANFTIVLLITTSSVN